MPSRYSIIAVGATVAGAVGGAVFMHGQSPEIMLVSPPLVAIAVAIAAALINSADWGPKQQTARTDEPKTAEPAVRSGQFRLQSLLLAVTFIAIGLGTWRFFPGLAIVVLLAWAFSLALKSVRAPLGATIAMAVLVFFSVFAALFTFCTMNFVLNLH